MKKIKSNNSVYINAESVKNSTISKNRLNNPVKILGSGIVAFLLLAMTVLPIFTGNTQSSTYAEAGDNGIFCSQTLGSGMYQRADWESFLSPYAGKDKANRTWTMQEAIGQGAGFVQYYGEGEDTKDKSGVAPKPKPETALYNDHLAADGVSKKLEDVRQIGTCVANPLLIGIANLGMLASSGITEITQFVAVNSFNTNIICQDPANPSGSCINLMKLIGGTGNSNDGIIGALTSSIYYPLLIIVVAISAGWVAYIGLAKRQLRQALFGFIWICLSVILGLAMLLNPSILAKAPMAASNVVAACIVGAFNGDNCFDGSAGTGINYSNGASSSKNICKSSAAGVNVTERMQMTTASIGCSIWKAFVLEPLAQGSFGTSFENLDTKTGKISKAIESAGYDPDSFCVSLGSTKSYTGMSGSTLRLDTDANKVCNLLAYQMYLKVDAQSGNDGPPANQPDEWYKVIITSANDNSLWSAWSGNPLTKVVISLVSVLISALGGFIIIVVSLFSLVYYITSAFLMAFAPLFLLFGVHPGRGKKMLFGWLEQVVSNMVKYMIGAAFLVVTLAIYGGILGATTNMGLIILFVLLITMALFMYRNELTGLVGRVNMGGEQLSSSMSNKLQNMAQNVGINKPKSILKTGSDLSKSTVGGGLGAVMAGGSVSAGMRDGLQRSLSRQGGVVGNIERQRARNTADNRSDLSRSMGQTRSRQQAYTSQVDDHKENVSNIQSKLDEAQATNQALINDSQAIQPQIEAYRGLENRTLQELREINHNRRVNKLQEIQNNPLMNDEQRKDASDRVNSTTERMELYFDWQDINNDLRDKKMELEIAIANDDQDTINALRPEINAQEIKANNLRDRVGAQAINNYQSKYERQLDHNIQSDVQLDDFSRSDMDNYVKGEVEIVRNNTLIDTQKDNLQKAQIDLLDAQINEKKSNIESDMMEKKYKDFQPGDRFTSSDSDLFMEQVKSASDNNDEVKKLTEQKDSLINSQNSTQNRNNEQFDNKPNNDRGPEDKPNPVDQWKNNDNNSHGDRKTNKDRVPDKKPEPIDDWKKQNNNGNEVFDTPLPDIPVPPRPDRSRNGNNPGPDFNRFNGGK